MNIWAKMITALRGGVNEAGETIIDSQALRILDQEVRDANEELKKSKEGLTTIIARQKLAEEKCLEQQQQIEDHEGYAIKALEQEEEALALEVAQKIADIGLELETHTKLAVDFASSADKLKKSIRFAEQNIKRMKQQIDTVKANESVLRAQATVAQRYNGSNIKLLTAMDSLERIKEKQMFTQAKIDAAEELSQESDENSLNQKLEKAGITTKGTSAHDVLLRLKIKK